jgi:hypothetical protein
MNSIIQSATGDAEEKDAMFLKVAIAMNPDTKKTSSEDNRKDWIQNVV